MNSGKCLSPFPRPALPVLHVAQGTIPRPPHRKRCIPDARTSKQSARARSPSCAFALWRATKWKARRILRAFRLNTINGGDVTVYCPQVPSRWGRQSFRCLRARQNHFGGAVVYGCRSNISKTDGDPKVYGASPLSSPSPSYTIVSEARFVPLFAKTDENFSRPHRSGRPRRATARTRQQKTRRASASGAIVKKTLSRKSFPAPPPRRRRSSCRTR